MPHELPHAENLMTERQPRATLTHMKPFLPAALLVLVAGCGSSPAHDGPSKADASAAAKDKACSKLMLTWVAKAERLTSAFAQDDAAVTAAISAMKDVSDELTVDECDSVVTSWTTAANDAADDRARTLKSCNQFGPCGDQYGKSWTKVLAPVAKMVRDAAAS